MPASEKNRLPPNHGITAPGVEDYLNSMLPERDAVLAEMEARAVQSRIPIVGPVVGRYLYQLARISGARTVFEMGSAIGYSTIWWARALGEGGRVFYTDSDPRRAEEAQAYFLRAGVRDRIEILVGDAVDLLAKQQAHFDIIFNDVEKEDYPRVPPLAISRLRPGGLFVTDNVLWKGRVAKASDAAVAGDARTQAILRFNRILYDSPELFTTLLPMRDGLAISCKV